MNKSLANIVSHLFHPLLAPTYVFFLYLFVFTPGLVEASWEVFSRISFIFAIFLLTYMIPGVSTFLLVQAHRISDLGLSRKEDRRYPLALTLITFSITSIFCYNKIPHLPDLTIIMIFNTILIFMVFVITYFWKISAHATGIGGILSYFLLFMNEPTTYLMGWYFVMLILAGVVLSARLYLKEHSPIQIYAGLFLGALTVYAAKYFF